MVVGPSTFGKSDLGEDRLALAERDPRGAQCLGDAGARVLVMDAVSARRARRPSLDEASKTLAGRRRVPTGEPLHEDRSAGLVLEVGERYPHRRVADRAARRVPAGARHERKGIVGPGLKARWAIRSPLGATDMHKWDVAR